MARRIRTGSRTPIARSSAARLPPASLCARQPLFRATGITAYLKNKGLLEHAQTITNDASPRTTKHYDRREDEISLAI